MARISRKKLETQLHEKLLKKKTLEAQIQEIEDELKRLDMEEAYGIVQEIKAEGVDLQQIINAIKTGDLAQIQALQGTGTASTASDTEKELPIHDYHM